MNAKEFLRNSSTLSDKYSIKEKEIFDMVSDRMIEFAKYHVKQALKQASEDAEVTDESFHSMQESSFISIDRNSILDAYPLENIK